MVNSIINIAKRNNNISLEHISELNQKEEFCKLIELEDIIFQNYSNNPNILCILGIANKSVNDLDKAIKFFNLSLNLDPSYLISLNNLGNIYNIVGDYDNALEIFKKAIILYPSNNILFLNIANTYLSKQNYVKAIENYNKSLEIYPNNILAHLNISESYFKLNENNLALTHVMNAISLNPELEKLWKHFSLICSHTNFNTYDDKIANKIKILLNQPNNFDISINYALINKLKKKSEIYELLNFTNKSFSEDEIIRICNILNTTYFSILIKKIILTDLKFSYLCQNLRKAIIINLDKLNNNNDVLEFVVSLFKQCSLNEYIFYQTEEEKKYYCKLKETVEFKLKQKLKINELELYLLACYEHIDFFDKYLNEIKKIDSFEILVLEIKNNITTKNNKFSHTPDYRFKNNISEIVASMYEENPYPKWETLIKHNNDMTFEQFACNKNIKFTNKILNQPIKILVAGCGTGCQPISIANLFKNCYIDAIDISSSSLGYAQLKADEFKVNNIKFTKIDILDLDQWDKDYDYIECCGVLHHMENPELGLNILSNLLKNTGIMKIGLYSSMARETINKARNFIKVNNINYSLENLKKFRQAIIQKKPEYMIFKDLENNPDFYSTSNCRDLLFHVQERQYNLLEIHELLSNNNLIFSGFDLNNQNVMMKFNHYFPNKNSEFVLENWYNYEKKEPDTFIGMYNFFVKKTSSL